MSSNVINEFYADYQLGKIAEGVDQASDGVGQTADGIKQSMSLPPEVQAQAAQSGQQPNPVEGLDQIKDGLDQASNQLKDMADSKAIRDTGTFVPEGTLDQDEFKQVLDRYARSL